MLPFSKTTWPQFDASSVRLLGPCRALRKADIDLLAQEVAHTGMGI
jgi:hypothetical protein